MDDKKQVKGKMKKKNKNRTKSSNKEINIMLHDISKEDEMNENKKENAIKEDVITITEMPLVKDNESIVESIDNKNHITKNNVQENLLAKKAKNASNNTDKKKKKRLKMDVKRLIVCLIVFAILIFLIVKLVCLGVTFIKDKFSSVEITQETVAVLDYEKQPLTNYSIYKTIPTIKGVYLSEYTVSSNAQVDKWINICKEKEINAVVINVKNDDGRISFYMDNEVANEIGASRNTIKDPAELVLKLKQAGIFPIARIVAFKDPYLAANRPDLAIKDNAGGVLRVKSGNNYEAWVNPYNKDVWKYIVDISKEAADIGFKEIQYDYIRFATGPQMANANFGNTEGKTKRDIILEFSKYAKEELEKYGVYVSADVFGTIITSDLDASIVGQNYLEMSKIYDFICPMIYPSHYGNGSFGVTYPDLNPYEIIRGALKASNDVLSVIPEGEHKAVVRAWLQDFTATWINPHKTYGPAELRDQKRAVYDEGLDEWLLWNASNKYTIAGLESK